MPNVKALGSWLGRSYIPRGVTKQTKHGRPFISASKTNPQVETTTNTTTMSDRTGQPDTAEASVSSNPAPARSTSQIIALAQSISRDTEKLESYMRDNGLPMPSFDVDSPPDFPKLPEDVLESRRGIIAATAELRDLVTGPRETVRWGVWSFLDVLALQILNHFEIAKLVPVHGTIPLAELEKKTSLDRVNLARLLRTAMTRHIFREPEPGVIAHTAPSRLLAEDGDLQEWIGFNSEDIFPASAHVLQALKEHPEATSLLHTGFNFASDTVNVEPMFATLGRDPARAKRMGRAMASLTGGEGYEVSYFVANYDLSDVDAMGGTFVDIGGSHGFVCVDLAREYRGMKFIVQDLPKTVQSAPSVICEDDQVSSRIEFMAHDFFTEQVVKGADVYFFRWVIHNYSTPYAIKILQNLIPALKPGARIVINDHCLREPGQENSWDESVIQRMDLVMLTLLNAQERTEAEFRELFKSADERFVFKGVTRPKGCRMSIIEAIWEPEKNAQGEEVAAAAASE